MDINNALVVFQGKKIRRTWFNDEWWFVAVDIVEVLTDSKDPSGYLKDMRRRDEGFAEGWRQIATPLSIETPGGKQQINCVSTKGAFRFIQSIPSKMRITFLNLKIRKNLKIRSNKLKLLDLTNIKFFQKLSSSSKHLPLY